MSIHTYFKSLSSASTRRRPTRRSPPASRLCFEPLEDRSMPSFLGPVSYPAGTNPQAVLTADFNGDSRLDLAVVNSGSNNVSVLLGNMDGTFQPAQNSATGAGPLSVAVGDFNADGKLDLATANTGDVSVLLGNGNGTFQAPTNIGIGSDPAAVAVGDFNADGKLDLGVTSNIYIPGYLGYYGEWHDSYEEGRANVLLGTGAGAFSTPSTTVLGTGYRFFLHTGAAVADFNGDLKQDFAAVNNFNAVKVLLGSGGGTLGAPTNFSVGSSSSSVAAGDVNGDGKLDLVTANAGSGTVGSGTVSVLLGNGLGSFGAAQNYTAGTNPRSLAIADFNGDGKADLVTANPYSGTVDVLLGTGAGAFRPPVNVAAGLNPLGVAVGDFNGDGRPDAASANSGSNNLSVLLNDGIWPALGAPSITINDLWVTEGNIGTVSATFTVILSASYGQPVTVHYATADGNATLAGNDYQATSGTVTFAPGETNKPVTVLVNGDRLTEYNNEYFTVRLSDPTNAFVADATGEGNILDDEPHLSIDYGPIVVAEGNTGTTNAVFTVRLAAAYDVPVSLNLSTVEGDTEWWTYGWYEPPPAATSDIDFQAVSTTVTFAPGETIRTIPIVIYGDRLAELDEYFSVNLSDATIGTIDSGHAVGTILDDESFVSISINSASIVEGNTGTTALTFTVTLSAAYDAPVTVTYATADGSATIAGGDYQAKTDTLTFGIGETTKTITVPVNGDVLNEADETFLVNLSGAANATIANGQGVGTVRNDDSVPALAISDVTVTESNAGTVSATFTVSLSVASGQSVTVSYATADGTARAGSDYVAAAGSLTFAPGETSKTVTVLVNGDVLNEANETFFVNLSNPTNATIADGQGVGSILNDDAVPTLTINDVTVTEGNAGTVSATCTVSLSAASGQTVTVSYATADGTARAGSDYVAAAGSLTFAPGETSKTVTVLVNGDRLGEANELGEAKENFFVNLSSPTNATIADGQGVATIVDDEPRISISDVTKNEGRRGKTTLFTFTVTLSVAYDQAVTMSFTTVNGTATTSDSDYIAKTGTLTFAPGETTKTITIEVKGDSKQEANETFYLDLFGLSSNGLFTKSRGVGTILNDD